MVGVLQYCSLGGEKAPSVFWEGACDRQTNMYRVDEYIFLLLEISPESSICNL